MTNEQYLVVSYFAIGLLSFGIACITYLWLRPSFEGIVQAVRNNHFSNILKRVFRWGIILPALAGFFSVSFRSCSVDTYEKIICNRSYLIARNQEQISATLFYIVIALFVLSVIVLLVLVIIKKHNLRAEFQRRTNLPQ
ncbi:MAG: hypothetical protein KAR31_12535 [Candidatus Omnitrophica bacterium]|nr:hypothetical protein [Candidatus Omnitrophota bacterium]MCK5083728.1 hypothetical protein [Candidatus Omnitrophota bacterium]MCK5179200.1 hypothetical protein [Candidatus Omnitrophota bacterium]